MNGSVNEFETTVLREHKKLENKNETKPVQDMLRLQQSTIQDNEDRKKIVTKFCANDGQTKTHRETIR